MSKPEPFFVQVFQGAVQTVQNLGAIGLRAKRRILKIRKQSIVNSDLKSFSRHFVTSSCITVWPRKMRKFYEMGNGNKRHFCSSRWYMSWHDFTMKNNFVIFFLVNVLRLKGSKVLLSKSQKKSMIVAYSGDRHYTSKNLIVENIRLFGHNRWIRPYRIRISWSLLSILL